MATPRASTIGLAIFASACGAGEARENGTASVAAPGDASERKVTREAEARLRAMSDHIAALDAFSLHAEGSIEVVLESGQKLSFPFESEVQVRRPDRLRSDRIGKGDEMQFFYDGRTFTFFDKDANLYARAAAPKELDEAMETARLQLGLEAPGADLLDEDPYALLTEDVVSGYHVGEAAVDGVRCQHLAFRGSEVDWQIWIQDGPQPLPCRFVITSKQIEGAPEFVVDYSNWNTSPTLGDEVFAFTPPPGAKEIEFISPTDAPDGAIDELPAGCTTMEGPAYACGDKTYRPFFQGTTLMYVPSRGPAQEKS